MMIWHRLKCQLLSYLSVELVYENKPVSSAFFMTSLALLSFTQQVLDEHKELGFIQE